MSYIYIPLEGGAYLRPIYINGVSLGQLNMGGSHLIPMYIYTGQNWPIRKEGNPFKPLAVSNDPIEFK